VTATRRLDETRHAVAIGYILGRRDQHEEAGRNPGEVGGSTEFANYYVATQKVNNRIIQDAYGEWVAAGKPDPGPQS
jgi:hypothetical protein